MRGTRPGGDGTAADYFDLGDYRRAVSTRSAQAATWFNRGLVWSFAFAHEEAAECFARAHRADPDCAMAHWGRAYVLGPYYNKQWHQYDEQDLRRTLATCHAEVQRALAKAAASSEVEQALIEALSARYPKAEPNGDFDAWNDAYADAMRAVYRRFPDDPDVSTLFADALMNRTPWRLWELRSGAPAPGASTLEAVEVLDHAMRVRERAGLPDHPGLLHLHIHLWEMSRQPETALPSADRLFGLVPDAGHLLHMPTHIYAQCGDYYSVVRCNDAAIAADARLLEYAGPMGLQALSRAHNYHFKLYGAMMLGHYRAARDATEGMVQTIPEDLLRVTSPPMADWLEGYVSMQVHADIRFGRWRELLARPLPRDRELYCATTAMLHYAKGVAHAVLGEIEGAEAQRALFAEAVTRVPATRTVFNNTCLDLMAVATCMLEGELDYRKGNADVAFARLREAVERADSLPYDEPWGWMQPPRHALGALLLEQGRLAEAESVYRTDLGLGESLIRACEHLDNVWSLHGLHECLRRQGKEGDARMLAPRLALALARTDVPIRASCLCRLQVEEGTVHERAG